MRSKPRNSKFHGSKEKALFLETTDKKTQQQEKMDNSAWLTAIKLQASKRGLKVDDIINGLINDTNNSSTEAEITHSKILEADMMEGLVHSQPSTSTTQCNNNPIPLTAANSEWFTAKRKNKYTPEAAQAPPTTIKTSPIKPPPIVTRGVVVANFFQSLQMEEITATCKMSNTGKQQIRCPDMDNHKKVLQKMRDVGIQGHTYTSKSERTGVIVLKGVHGSTLPKDIQEDIMRQTGVNARVSQVETTKSKQLGFKIGTYIISTDKWEEIAEITKISHIGYHEGVLWERLRKFGPIQCRRCQRLGHVSRNCLNEYRCVKCPEKHQPGQCRRIFNEENAAEAFCQLCQQKGHVSSYTECPRKAKVAQAVNNMRQQKEAVKQQSWAQVAQGVSFADCLRPSHQPQTQKQHPTTKQQEGHQRYQPNAEKSFFEQESKKLFNSDFSTITSKMREFIPYYKNIQGLDEQKLAFISFVLELCF